LEPDGVPILIAFAAGILSFLSPCQLAVVPGFVGHLSKTASGEASSRARTVSHAVAFVLGFSAVFVVLGASVGLVGYLLYDYLPILRKVGGVVLIVFGLQAIGVLTIPFLYREARVQVSTGRRSGYLSSLLLGLAFGIGWTPCIGLTLAGILLLASSSQTAAQGALLLMVYSLGLGLPFLGTALALGRASRLLRRINRRGNLVSMASGALLVGMGMLVYTNQIARLPALFGGWAPFSL
jgi:cytochrome c-type biogenesis protein